MEMRKLGNTGIEVSAMGLGAWQIVNPELGGSDRAEAIGIVHAALDAGCNFIDTAPNYAEGMSERILGEALKGRRQEVVLCSKFGHHAAPAPSDFRPSVIRGVLAESFRRMGTDYLDVLMVHSPPRELMDGGMAPDLYGELDALKAEGLIRAYGVSLDWSGEMRAVMGTTNSQALEVMYNALHQEPAATFAEAADRGVGLIVKVPLDSGWLSGRYGPDTRFTDIRGRWTPEVLARRTCVLERLKELVPSGGTLAGLALRFCLARAEVSTVIPGAKTAAQARQNMAAAEGALDPGIVAEIEKIWREDLAENALPW
jgi:aryl-alcohol dehydrogenase-like predicted oxidoreductase